MQDTYMQCVLLYAQARAHMYALLADKSVCVYLHIRTHAHTHKHKQTNKQANKQTHTHARAHTYTFSACVATHAAARFPANWLKELFLEVSRVETQPWLWARTSASRKAARKVARRKLVTPSCGRSGMTSRPPTPSCVDCFVMTLCESNFVCCFLSFCNVVLHCAWMSRHPACCLAATRHDPKLGPAETPSQLRFSVRQCGPDLSKATCLPLARKTEPKVKPWSLGHRVRRLPQRSSRAGSWRLEGSDILTYHSHAACCCGNDGLSLRLQQGHHNVLQQTGLDCRIQIPRFLMEGLCD